MKNYEIGITELHIDPREYPVRFDHEILQILEVHKGYTSRKTIHYGARARIHYGLHENNKNQHPVWTFTILYRAEINATN